MTNLSEYNKYYRTSNADAVAADIASGKIAYGADGKLIGSAPTADLTGGSIVLLWDFMQLPNAVLGGTEEPQYMASGITIDQLTNLTKTANGLSANTSSDAYLRFSGLPTQTGRRRYVVTYDLDELNAPTNSRIDVRWNWVDSWNYWFHQIIDQSSDWVGLLYERTANVLTERDRTTWLSTIENCTMQLCIEDYGDEVQISETVAETGTGNVANAVTNHTWYASSRPNKTGTGLELWWNAHNASDLLRIQSLIIQDF